MSVFLNIPCGGVIHRAQITKTGKMVLLDHPKLDPMMVQAFVAFGAKRPLCPSRLTVWETDPALIITADDLEFTIGNYTGPMPLLLLGMITRDWARHVTDRGTHSFEKLDGFLDRLAEIYLSPNPGKVVYVGELEQMAKEAFDVRNRPGRAVNGHIGNAVYEAILTATIWFRGLGYPGPRITGTIYFHAVGVSSAAAAAAIQATGPSSLAVARRDAEHRWQGDRAALILNRIAEGKKWQPL